MGTQFEGFRDDDNSNDEDAFELNYNIRDVNQNIHFILNLYKINNFFRI